jgi:uncharacterized protein
MFASTDNTIKKPLMNLWGIAFLLLFILVFQLVGYGLSTFILSQWYGISPDEVSALSSNPDGSALSINIARFSNLIQFISYMGIPALLFTLTNRVSIHFFGGYNQSVSARKFTWSIIMALAALPVVAVLTEWSKHFPWPSGMLSIGRKLSEQRTLIFENMLDMYQWQELIFCIFLLAVLPAFLEEYLFRGIILKVGESQYKKQRTAIIFQAFVFSLLHFSIFEFLGIFMMGAVFGWVAQRNNSLWYNTVAHFVFNGVTVVGHYYFQRNFEKTGIQFDVDTILTNFSMAIPASLLLGMSVYQLSRPEKPTFQ